MTGGDGLGAAVVCFLLGRRRLFFHFLVKCGLLPKVAVVLLFLSENELMIVRGFSDFYGMSGYIAVFSLDTVWRSCERGNLLWR